MSPTELKSDTDLPKSSRESDTVRTTNGLELLGTFPIPQKAVLLTVFCFAQFLDAFNNSSFFAAIPPIARDLNISNSDSVWLISAYQLTFAALLLSVSLSSILELRIEFTVVFYEQSGRLSDIYNPSTYIKVCTPCAD